MISGCGFIDVDEPKKVESYKPKPRPTVTPPPQIIRKAEPLKTKPVSPSQRILIVLDPGHGGEDDGAVGIQGIREKNFVLGISKELASLLETRLPVNVELTRDNDKFIPLKSRTQLANDLNATLFVSLHANASPTKTVHGFETYYLDNTNDKASRLLAERENSSGREDLGDIEMILSDLIQSGKLDDSVTLANLIQRNVISTLAGKYKSVKSLGVRKAPFFVLVGAHMPCVLVEMFFVDSSIDGQNILKADFRRELSEGLYSGIHAYLKRSRVL